MSRQSLGMEDVVLKEAAGTLVMVPDQHPVTTIVLNAAYTAAAGVTLPKSTASGRIVRVYNAAVQTQVITIAALGTDVFYGVAQNVDSSALATHALGFVTSATSDKMVWDGTDGTSGGKGGDTFEAVDVADGKWFVKVVSFTTGTNDTPFSAT